MAEKRAIVVGAGILGLATARALALKGYQVDVYDRSLKVSGASVRNFGMIWPIGQPAGKLYARGSKSLQIWKDIAADGGLWTDPVGSLHLAYNPEEWQVLRELHAAFGNENRPVELLHKNAVLAISPLTNPLNCFGGLFSSEEMIVDPREAMSFLPEYFHEKFGMRFHWGRTVSSAGSGYIRMSNDIRQAELVVICSGADFETLYPEEFAKHALTKCKLQMMRFLENGTRRMGPALCGGLSLIHYKSFEAAVSLPVLKKRYEEELPEYLKWGIHVMVSQNQAGQLTIGDSHEYGLSPDPFDRKFINELILKYLESFAVLKDPRWLESWNGVYGKFTDGHTELFYSPEPGVYILNGVGGTGMTLSFGLAEEMIATI